METTIIVVFSLIALIIFYFLIKDKIKNKIKESEIELSNKLNQVIEPEIKKLNDTFDHK